MTFKDVVDKFVQFIDMSIVPLFIVLGLVFFLIGMLRFFFSQNEETRQNGRQFAVWGLIALFVMVSVWGIVNLFLKALTG